MEEKRILIYKILIGLVILVLAIAGVRIFAIVLISVLEMGIVLPYEVIYIPIFLAAVALIFSLSVLVQIIKNRTG
ncbi:MAG: hypothetical protein ACFFDC_19920 [Promethearchaeota archaeon]